MNAATWRWGKFMLIGQVWADHHVMFDHIRHADRLVLFLNTVLLMDIAFIPFAAAVLAQFVSRRTGRAHRRRPSPHCVRIGSRSVQRLVYPARTALQRRGPQSQRVAKSQTKSSGISELGRR